MIKTKPQHRPNSITKIFNTLVVLLLATVAANAQWTTPDASQNINNTNTGNVGIGTTTPTSKLEVNGRIRQTGSSTDAGYLQTNSGLLANTTALNPGIAFYGGNGVNALYGADLGYNSTVSRYRTRIFSGNFLADVALGRQQTAESNPTQSAFLEFLTVRGDTGNVGIGTTSPGERLVTFGNFLAGNITSHTQLYSSYDSQSNVIMELGYGTATADITPLPSLVISKNLTGTNTGLGVISFANSSIANGSEKRLASIATFTDGALNSGALTFGTTASGTYAERMRISSAGRLGIGTTNPQDALHLFNTTNAVGTMRLQGGNTYAAFLGMWDAGPMLLLTNNRHPGTGNNFNTGVVGAQITLGAASNPGDIGFLTTTSGTVGNSTELVRIKASGLVGIGTITPGYKLDVQGGSINATGGLCIGGDCKTAWSQVGGSSQWTTSGSTINYSAGNVGVGVASPTTKLDVAGTVNASALTVSGSPVVSSQWATSGATINYGTGNVGVATAAPTEKLHVTGNVKVTGNLDVGGNINAKYQDVAEWVESSQQLSAGTVVVLDPDKNNQVVASTQSYDSRVAGVISLQPGISLGERGEGRVLVAATGRVKVKVDASNGPIRIGDLLVTSDQEGFAMKSVPVELGGVRIHRPGTLIGKALEPLAKGTGEILVLLSLQ